LYESLTCLIPALQNGQAGEWIIDRKNDGTRERPIQFPSVSYGDAACNLMEEMHCFAKKHPEFELNQYQTILEKKKNEQGCDSVWAMDVDQLDGKTVTALLLGAARAERFSEGTLLRFCKDGSVVKWLKRLKELDEG